MMGWGWMSGFGGVGWLGWLWPILMLAFWVLVIGGGIWVATTLFRTSPSRGASEDGALEVLRRRYARGDITREEYEEGRRLLGS